jgi:hypothetical protein
MLPKERQMQVLEAYDLTRSFRAAGQLTGVDHHTVARVVTARALGQSVDDQSIRSKVADAFAEKIVEWIERSGGKVRADVVHEKLRAMGYAGSERTTRRVVASLKANYNRQNHRIYKPWITEPGMWLQYDFGADPVIEGVATILFCAWLAWSRFRVIIPLGNRSLPSVIYALDKAFRLIGGAPTYVFCENVPRNIFAEDDPRKSIEEFEGVHVRVHPVRELLRGDCLGVEVVGGPEHGDEEFGVQAHRSGLPVVDGEGLSGEVDEELLACSVLLAHHEIEVATEVAVVDAELAVAIAIWVLLAVLEPQQHERHPRATKLFVELGPVGHRPSLGRRRRLGEQQCLEAGVVEVLCKWPGQVGQLGTF